MNRQNAIFNRFEQADIEDKDARQGSGIGLSIVKAYVNMLGGKIWVDSKENQGTTLFFIIPARLVKQKNNDDFIYDDTEKLFERKTKNKDINC